MAIHKRAALLLLSVSVTLGSTTLMALQGQNKSKEKKKTAMVLRRQDQTEQTPSEQEVADQLPVADAAAPESTDPDKRAKREKKNKRYDNQSSRRIEDAPYPVNVTWSTHWWQGLSAIPVTQSDIVLVGEITDARAYLSGDRTGIYSEFTVSAGEILKNDASASLYPGSIVTAERFGGAVRFPSGSVQRYTTRNQRMPLVGRQYVLFLKRIGTEQEFSLVTAYELRSGRVVPLDGANTENGEKLPFDDYKGADSSVFLNTVRDAVAQNSSERR
ncbi:MAG TPA: hypothetical protein VJT09_10510 [Pyrinomonadaceae bacterium]|nr:hypothetical protein [Pyrinomonadaceae bacterium]